jgi:glycosyltransferase involved in cell wall biosynthesis
MHALAASGPGAGRIRFTGWVGGADRRALLGGAGLFALPSHQENFGFALAEAMASGVAVIVSPGVNLAADIAAADAGWIGNRDGFGDVLAEALARPELCRERGQKARAYAEAFRWPRVAEDLARIYRSLAAARAGVPRLGTPVAAAADSTGVCS